MIINQRVLNEALNYLDEDVIERYLKLKIRRGEKQGKTVMLKYCAVAAMLVIIILSFAVIPGVVKYMNGKDEFKLPVNIDEILWNEAGLGISAEGEPRIVTWNGLNVTESLGRALESIGDTDYIAINVDYDRTTDEIREYVYNGKKIFAYVEECDSLYWIPYKLKELLKDGEKLKYGELLYAEGIPDGTKWSKAYYEARVSYYGEELLEKYIKNGVFLSTLVNEDIIKAEEDYDAVCKTVVEAYNEYYLKNAEELCELFSDAGYSSVVRNNSMLLFVQKEELISMTVDNVETMVFDFAPRIRYESSYPGKIEAEVRGFNISKIHFGIGTTIDNEQLVNDEDVVDAINESMLSLQYTVDSFEFIIYYCGDVHEDDLENMNYEKITWHNDPIRVTFIVPFKNINMDALKNLSELSNMKEVFRISIVRPLDSMLVSE